MMVDGSPEFCYGCNTLFADRPAVYAAPAANNSAERIDNFVTASSSVIVPDQTRYENANIFSFFLDTFLFPLKTFFDLGLAIYKECENKIEKSGGLQTFERSAASVVNAGQNIDGYSTTTQFATQFVRSMMRGR